MDIATSVEKFEQYLSDNYRHSRSGIHKLDRMQPKYVLEALKWADSLDEKLLDSLKHRSQIISYYCNTKALLNDLQLTPRWFKQYSDKFKLYFNLQDSYVNVNVKDSSRYGNFFTIHFSCEIYYNDTIINNFYVQIPSTLAHIEDKKEYIEKKFAYLVGTNNFIPGAAYIADCLKGSHPAGTLETLYEDLCDCLVQNQKKTSPLPMSIMSKIAWAVRDYVSVGEEINDDLRYFMTKRMSLVENWCYIEAENLLITITSGNKYPMVAFNKSSDDMWVKVDVASSDLTQRFYLAKQWLRPTVEK